MEGVVRIGPCQRCGVVRFRQDGKREPSPICGWCAAKEILRDASWARPDGTHDLRKVAVAAEYLAAQSDLAVMTELLCSKAELAKLRARVALFQQVRKAAA
jgi:hypothetical protein